MIERLRPFVDIPTVPLPAFERVADERPSAGGPGVGQRSNPNSLTSGGILSGEYKVVCSPDLKNGTVDNPVIGSVGRRELGLVSVGIVGGRAALKDVDVLVDVGSCGPSRIIDIPPVPDLVDLRSPVVAATGCNRVLRPNDLGGSSL